MNIIIVRDVRRKPLRLSLSARRLYGLVAASIMILLGIVGSLGYVLGDEFGEARRTALGTVQALKSELSHQADRIHELRQENDRQLNALALRLGDLQARSARIDALGERLTKIGQMDDGEFDFDGPPAMGGPEMAAAAEAEPFDLAVELLTLESHLERQERDLGILEQLISDRELDESLEPAGRPVDSGWLASRFGSRVDPFTGEPDYHPGVDFSGRKGAEVLAVADGVVIAAGKHYQYGNMIDIDHGNGYVTRYAHNEENLVKLGDRVRAGDRIAKMGATGRATGVHVHFEVWYEGRRIDPMQMVSRIRG
ncbi:MAG: M23 family metallopeptidase [Xanthomonadales bacterium]|nr:M23 family metallopeptidase [Xanthomonadales bacterium]